MAKKCVWTCLDTSALLNCRVFPGKVEEQTKCNLQRQKVHSCKSNLFFLSGGNCHSSKAKGFLNGGKCSVSFFGVKTNVQLAAYAFKNAAERIAFMTASYDPPRASQMVPRQASLTRTARLSYAIGIVAGLQKHVEDELKEEEEKRQETLRGARSAAKTGEAYHEDEHDNGGQYDEDIPQREHLSMEEKVKQLENEQEARLALVDHNKKIAKDVLKVRDLCILKTIYF